MVLNQRQAAVKRQSRLLAVLHILSGQPARDGRPLDRDQLPAYPVDDIIIDLVPDYFAFDGTREQRWQAWEDADLKTREAARLMFQRDAEGLQAVGYGVERESVGPPGDKQAQVLCRLVPQPFVPVAMPVEDVPVVVGLVAAVKAGVGASRVPSTVDDFARAAAARLLVDVRGASGKVTRVVPDRVVTRGIDSRWYGIGWAERGNAPLTFRLDAAEVTVLEDSPVSQADRPRLRVDRMLSGLTWGRAGQGAEHVLSVRVAERAMPRARRELGPAITHERVVGGAHLLDLSVTDLGALAAVLCRLGDAVTVTSPPPRDRDFLHRALLRAAQPCDWVPPETPVPAVPWDANTQADVPATMRSVAAPVASSTLDGRSDATRMTGALLIVISYVKAQAATHPKGVPAAEVAAAAGMSVATLGNLLAAYDAALAEVENEMPARSVFVDRLTVVSDARGRPVTIAAHHDGIHEAESVTTFGRFEVTAADLFLAVVAAFDRLDVLAAAAGLDPDRVADWSVAGEEAAALARFVASASHALGLAPDVIDHVPSEPDRQVQQVATQMQAWVGLRDAVVTFDYFNPFSLVQSRRRVAPLAVRVVRGRPLLDAVDLDVGLDQAAVRTFFLEWVSDAEMTRVTPAPAIVDRGQLLAEARREELITVAVRPGANAAEYLRRAWGATTQPGSDGLTFAFVRVSPPVRDRVAEMLLTRPGDMCVVAPPQYGDTAADLARTLLQHHGWALADDAPTTADAAVTDG